ncbi:MAG TPA: tetratricopeptide repeat protein [Candidatus Saccharimonadales bacterium]|nr:tetratricopeptide repeat protein [Candidatus Saccharimonadales bacterium]
MIALLVVALASFFLYRLLGGAPTLRINRKNAAQQNITKIKELSDYAHRLRVSNKFTGAEKVYLQILKIDHKHAATYSRLGTLYVAMKNLGDAVECFQIAAQLSPSGSTYYNLGLGYYENRNYLKAVAAFEKAIMFEPSVQRHVGLAKTFEKIGDPAKMLSALEQAVQLEDNTKVLWMLGEAYASAGRPEDAMKAFERLIALDAKDTRAKKALAEVKVQLSKPSSDLGKAGAA